MSDNSFTPISPQQSSELDPYAPPSAQVAAPLYSHGEQAPLADRGSRFVAQLLNGLVCLPALLLIIIPIVLKNPNIISITETDFIGKMTETDIICVSLGILYMIALLVINLRLLSRNGQSLGKKWAKIRIVRNDGSRVSLGRLIALRYIVNLIPGQIPYIGDFYGIVDILFIFRADRRCIHDLIADTKVVVA